MPTDMVDERTVCRGTRSVKTSRVRAYRCGAALRAQITVHRFGYAAHRGPAGSEAGPMVEFATHPYVAQPVAVSRGATLRNGRSDGALRAALDRGELIRPLHGACGGRYRVGLVVQGRVFVEFGGSHHDLPDTQFADRRRFNVLAARPDRRVLRYTSRDLSRLGAVVAEVRAALSD